MHLIDWIIVAVVFIGLAFVAVITQRHVKGVSDFLAANRLAGRYLLTLADGMAGLGAIGIIASFQQTYTAGLGAAWWGGIMGPLMMILPLTGFIVYRFRESRVMTMAEFYEKRYSRRFRIFAGFLAWFAGIINYGVFPQVTARFFIYFCNIPRYHAAFGPVTIDVTHGVVMAVLLVTALVITFRGGQIAIMVTDFFQAQFVNLVFLILFFFLLWKFSLGDVIETLASRPEDKSMLNPFDQANVTDFNIWFYMIGAFNIVYTYMAWQGNQGYNCSARTPHDAKMAKILASWRYGATWTVISIIPIFIYVVIHGTGFPEAATHVQGALEALGDEGLRRQLTVPLALREILPLGIFGLFVAAMLAAAVSTDDTYLHSWGSIFVQDILVPLRKKPLDSRQHMRWLRRSILGVAVFVWLFGMVFPLFDFIFMYWAITGAIYVGGAGSVIIGGFYWRRATKEGAWAGMIAGSLLGVTGALLTNVIWPRWLPWMKTEFPGIGFIQSLPDDFWFNGMHLFFFACAISIILFVTVSLLTRPDPDFDLNRLLHRGKYALTGEHTQKKNELGLWTRLIGIDKEFSGFDKFVSWSVFGWTMFWFTVFVLVSIWAGIGQIENCTFSFLGFSLTVPDLPFFIKTTDRGWGQYFLYSLGIWIVLGPLTVGWFLWGGFQDLSRLFKDLRTTQRDVHDDGFVYDIDTEMPLTGNQDDNEAIQPNDLR